MSGEYILSNTFPTEKVQPNPFKYNENTIIYCDRYEEGQSNDDTGIFEYDIETSSNKLIKTWKSMKYYPRRHCVIFSKKRNLLYCIGGMNVKEGNQVYEDIMTFNISTKECKIIPIGIKFGHNARIVLTDNDDHLHIIGGNTDEGNHKHIKLDLNSMKTIEIHSFAETNPNISEHAVLFNKTKNQIYMFGGISFWDFGNTDWQQYDDFWVCDKKWDNDKVLQIIHAWYDYDIPAEIINIILSYDDYHWYKNDAFTLPDKMRVFGYILYDDRIIITFGGDGYFTRINSVYYLDLNDDEGWVQSRVKLGKAGYYTALMMNENTIYVLPSFCGETEYYIIKINQILPESLIAKSRSNNEYNPYKINKRPMNDDSDDQNFDQNK